MKPKVNLEAACKAAMTASKKHAPGIFMGIGIVGMVSATVLAVEATPKALTLIEEKKKETGKEKLTVVETVKTAGPCYIPTAISSVLGVACLVTSGTVSHKRNTALAAACALSESALTEYQAKTLETVGQKKEQEIRDAIAKDQVEKIPKDQEVYLTGKGETLCYDTLCGRPFRTDIEKLRQQLNEFNDQLLREGYLSLNDWYYLVGLDETELGGRVGWNIEDGLVKYSFTSDLNRETEPYLVVGFKRPPTYNYDRTW